MAVLIRFRIVPVHGDSETPWQEYDEGQGQVQYRTDAPARLHPRPTVARSPMRRFARVYLLSDLKAPARFRDRFICRLIWRFSSMSCRSSVARAG